MCRLFPAPSGLADVPGPEETPNILKIAEVVARIVSEVLRRRDSFFSPFPATASSSSVVVRAIVLTEPVDPDKGDIESEKKVPDGVMDVVGLSAACSTPPVAALANGREGAGFEEETTTPAVTLLLTKPLLLLKPVLVEVED